MTIDRRKFLAVAGAGAGLAGLGIRPAFSQAGNYPSRPITLTLPWAAGGGTDATARILGSLLEKDLGQPVNVVNRTGGAGVVGHSALATAAPDGYTIGLVTVEITMMHRQGLTDLTPASYTPLALVMNPAPGVLVNSNSPYKDVKALAEAIKKSEPGKFKASGTAQGGSWHIGLVGWLLAMGLKADHVQWVPSQGAAPALQDLAAGGIDLATCSIPEGRAMIDAGRIRALASMSSERNPQFPDVPTLNEATGINHSFGAWQGVTAPKGIPDDIKAKLIASIEKAYKSAEFAEFVKARGFSPQWAAGDAFGKFMSDQNDLVGKAMEAAGLVKKA